MTCQNIESSNGPMFNTQIKKVSDDLVFVQYIVYITQGLIRLVTQETK